jgi:hypothetical protein
MTYVLKTEGNDPIVNVTITVYNDTGDLVVTDVTNAWGNVSLDVLASSTFAVYGEIPSSNYHAVLSQVDSPSSVFLNDVLSGSARLTNTLGQALEAQDCSVVTMENDTNRVIRDYRTLCYAGEPYIDSTTGNWVSFSKCPFTDSNGNYYFNTIISDGEGYQTGKYYLLQFTCNGKTNSSLFYVDVSKPTDVSSWFDWARRYSGILVIYLVLGVALIILIYLIKRGVS